MKDFAGFSETQVDKVESMSEARRIINEFPEPWNTELGTLTTHVLDSIDQILESQGEFLGAVPNLLDQPEVIAVLEEMVRANEGFEELALKLAGAMKGADGVEDIPMAA